MDRAEIRLRLIEAAAKNPDPRHTGGFAASVLEQAKKWEEWVNSETAGPSAPPGKGTLSLPKK